MKKYLFPICILSIALISGCSAPAPATPDKALDTYFKDIAAGDYTTAYSLLCKADQKLITSDEFVQWQTLAKKTDEVKTASLTPEKETKDFKDSSGNTYTRAELIKVKETDFSHSKNKEAVYEYERQMVWEDNAWKLARLESKDAYQHRFYAAYVDLGNQYKTGSGQVKDYAKSVEMFQSALKYKPDSSELCFQIALGYLNLQKPVDSEKWARQGISKTKDSTALSELQNLLGVTLQMQGKNSESRAAFKEAVRLNPKNQNAVDNLNLSNP